MSDQPKTDRLLAAIEEQAAVLTAVAEERREAAEAEGDYRRLHAEMGSLLAGADLKCFCPWSSVHQWYGLAMSLGDPAWRQRLEQMVAPFRAHLTAPAEQPRYQLRRYVRAPGDVPFAKWQYEELAEAKQVLLDRSLSQDLAHQGQDICRDPRKGKMISRSGGRKVIEYKIQANASTVGYPKDSISLRVFWCWSADGAIVLLHGYDKGAHPGKTRQDREIDEAFGRLAHYRAQEAAVAARTQGQY